MQIRVTARHVEITDEVRSYIDEKVGKLERFYDRIQEVEVILDHESEQFTAGMVARTDRKHTFVASETGPDTFALIDLVTEKLERQLKRHKEKSRSYKGGAAADGNVGET